MSKEWRERLDDLSYDYALARQFKTKGNAERYSDVRNQVVAEIEAAVAVAEAQLSFVDADRALENWRIGTSVGPHEKYATAYANAFRERTEAGEAYRRLKERA